MTDESNRHDTVHELKLKTEQLLFFRFAFAGVALILAGGMQWFDKTDLDVMAAIYVLGFVMAYSGLCLSVVKNVSNLPRAGLAVLNGTLIAIDVLSLTAIVHYTRGVESDLYVLYLLPILLSSYTFGRRGINATALFVSVSYVSMMLIENKHFLPYLVDPDRHTGLVGAYSYQLWKRILAKSAVLVSVSFIWARFCEYMSGLAQQGEQRLRDQLEANTELMAEVKAQAAREQLINSINSAIRSTLDLSQIFETAVDELGRALHADVSAIVCPGEFPDSAPMICQSAHTSIQRSAVQSATHLSVVNIADQSRGAGPGISTDFAPAGALRNEAMQPGAFQNSSRGDAAFAAPSVQSLNMSPLNNNNNSAISSAGVDPGNISLLPAGLLPVSQAAIAPVRSLLTLDKEICEFILLHKGNYEKSVVDGSVVRMFIFDDPANEPVFQPIRESIERSGVSSLIVRPMMYADESKGVIIIAASERREWMSSELELVKSVAGQVAVAIEQVELLEQLSAKNSDLLQKNLNLDTKNMELRAVQSQLIHHEKMASLGRLVAGIAHELNNPINFVHGNLPYLREYFDDLKQVVAATDDIPAEQRRRVDELRTKLKYEFLVTDLDNILADLNEGAERIRFIVRNLKSFSRLDEAELKEASIQDGIESTLKILSQYYGRDKIPVETDFAPISPVLCYPGQLNQVWMNLLSNAAQALETRTDASVSVKVEGDGNGVLISIRDNGPGIKPEVQSKIFEPFYTTKPVGQGTGLGLSISHSIVERHGGQIWCESKMGEGTTFKVRIPIHAKASDLVKLSSDLASDPD